MNATAPAERIRAAVTRSLTGATLDPFGVPPSALLLIRRVQDPLPRALVRVDHPYAPAPDWERSMRSALDRCARAAAHPAAGPVPPTANAVLFADQAELLACLARDLAAGDAARQWWWAALRRSLPPGALEALVAAWCRDAPAVPAALDLLVRWRAAEGVLRTLTPAQAVTVLRAILDAYALTELLDATSPTAAAASPARPPVAPPPPASPTPAPRTVPQSAPQPWEPLVPAALVPPSLGQERRLLLGVSLTLTRAPLVARTIAYRERLASWWQAERARETLPVPDTVPLPRATVPRQPGSPREPPAPQPVTDAGDVPTPRRPTDRAPRRGDAPAVGQGRTTGYGRREPPNAPPQERARRAASRSEHPFVLRSAPRQPLTTKRAEPSPRPRFRSHAPASPSTPSSSAAAPPPAIRAARHTRGPTSPDVTSVSLGDRATLQASPVADVAWTDTRLGGVFFLVTLLVRLDFFNVLEHHFAVSSSIGGWGWVDLLARAMLGRRFGAHAADPVWRCLAALDGRDPDVPFTPSFRGPGVYVLPPQWIADVQPPALPSALTGSDRRALRSLLVAPPALLRFLGVLLPFLRWRLRRALRLSSDRDLPAALFEAPAKVFASNTHVDVRLPLTAARVAVRQAGIDANPGWVPALGRVVSFEFV